MSAGVIASAGDATTYQQYMASLGPLIWMKLDEASGGAAVDSSGNGRHMTVSSYTWQEKAIAYGTSGFSVINIDNNSRMNIAHASWMDVSAVTAFLIHRPHGLTTGYLMAIDDGGSGNGEMSWDILRNAAGTLSMQHRNGAGSVVTTTGGAYYNSVPMVIAYSLSAAAEELYVNGQLVLTGASPQAPRVGTGQLRAGNLNGSAFPGTGHYDEFAMFGAHLTAAQHLQLATLALGRRNWPNAGSSSTPTWAAGTALALSQTKLLSGGAGFAAGGSGESYIARADTVPTELQSNAAQTIEFWFSKPAGTVLGSLFKIDAGGGTGNGGWGLGVGGANMDVAGANLLMIREGIAFTTLASSLTTGNHHVVAIRNGTNIQVYLDGTSVYNANPGTINAIDAAAGMTFGGYLRVRNLSASVKMDKCAIYNSALSGARVTAHWNGGAGDDAAVAADSPTHLLDLDYLP